jgi:hypothetical protein
LSNVYQPDENEKIVSAIAWAMIIALFLYIAVSTYEKYFIESTPGEIIISKVEAGTSTESSNDEISTDTFEVDVEQNNQSQEGQNPVVQNTSSNTEVENEEPVGIEIELPTEQSTEEPVTSEENNINISDYEESRKLVSKAISTEEPDTEPVVEPTVTETAIVVEPQSTVKEPVADGVGLYLLKLQKTFESFDEIFGFMKQVDYGERKVQLEVIESNGRYEVLLGEPYTDYETRKLRSYLAIRNHGLGLNVVKAQARPVKSSSNTFSSDSLEGVSSPKPVPVRAGTVESFKKKSQAMPYTIQIGSFLREEGARALRNQMMSKGYDADVEEVTGRGVVQYKVLVGNFFSRREAGSLASKLSEEEKVPVFIRRVLE